MSEVLSSVGDSAGVLWQMLHQKGSLSEAELLNLTQLQPLQLYASIGWLARENKIRKENNLYSLGHTNLTESIGHDAGKIWVALEIWGEVDTLSLQRLSRIPSTEVFCALGWLAREGKIDAEKKNNDSEKMLYRLK